LEAAFLRLRHAADADEYVPTEQVIDTVLARLTRAEKENRWEAYAAFGSNYKDVTAEVIDLREPMRKLREALDMPTQGEGYVIDFAIRDLARLNTHVADLHHRFNTLGEERDEALRLLATRVEAKRLDEAQEEIERLRAACTLALRVMEQTNRVTVPPFAKFITLDFAPEDIAVLRAALEKKP
jgi:hypothetical protein